ncbi:MAG: glycerophosphodiester phosphodiesterase [Clostridia bacterium]|nr:glycerophosphodiester phosphodiesterase [Clostridia bacterium]
MIALVITLSSVLAFLLLLFILYILSLKCGKRREGGAYFASQIYAHRGYHNKDNGIPENSMAAFFLAIERGYGIELDVQLSKDDEVVVFHDTTLNRVCGVDARVRDFTLAELKELSLSGVEGEKIPTLNEVLALVDGKVPLLVEIKAETLAIQTTEAAQKILDGYTGRYCIESFNPFVVSWYRKNRPEIIRGMLSDMFMRDKTKNYTLKHRVLQTMLFNFLASPDFVAYNFKNSDSIPFRLAKKIYKPYTFAWTPKSEGEVAECKDFDSVIFENAEL